MGSWRGRPVRQLHMLSWVVFGLRAAAATILGGLLAFAMLLVELRIVQLASSLTLSIAGVFKEVLTVATSAVLLGDRLSVGNAVGLALCLTGIAGYHLLRH